MKRGAPLERRSGLKADPDKVRAFQQRARQASAANSKPRMISPASPQQRLAMVGRGCVICTRTPVDPAHLIDRSLCSTGADEALAVIALCRTHHRAYDEGALDLLPYEARFREELVFAVHRYGLLKTLHRVTGCRWAPEGECR